MSSIPLGESVHRLMHTYKYLLRKGVRDQKIELPVTHIRVLKGICRSTESTANSIAQLMHRDKAQITRALNDLIDAGLIIKINNPLDRRSQLLKLTPKGKKTLAKLDAVEDWAVKQLTRNIAADDLAVFLRVSNAMADSIEQTHATDTGEQ